MASQFVLLGFDKKTRRWAGEAVGPFDSPADARRWTRGDSNDHLQRRARMNNVKWEVHRVKDPSAEAGDTDA